MGKEFDSEAAEKFLRAREEKEKRQREEERLAVLEKAIAILEQEFTESSTEAYLIGSILTPFAFLRSSDVDIVLKNYKGDRFDLWTRLEEKLGRQVEVILFETSPFQEFVVKEGFKVRVPTKSC